MPYYRRRRNFRQRRPLYRRRRRVYRRRPVFRRYRNVAMATPAKLKQLGRLKYSYDFVLQPEAAAVCAVHVFRANDLYDPDLTGIGHQPRGFDQWMALYQRFTVIYCKAYLKVACRDGTSEDVVVYLAHMPVSTANTDPNDYAETRHVKTKICSGGAGAQPVSLRIGASTWKLRGMAKPLANFDECSGTVSQSPVVQSYIHCAAAPMYNVDAGNYDCHIDLVYYAVFTVPEELNQS